MPLQIAAAQPRARMRRPAERQSGRSMRVPPGGLHPVLPLPTSFHVPSYGRAVDPCEFQGGTYTPVGPAGDSDGARNEEYEHPNPTENNRRLIKSAVHNPARRIVALGDVAVEHRPADTDPIQYKPKRRCPCSPASQHYTITILSPSRQTGKSGCRSRCRITQRRRVALPIASPPRSARRQPRTGAAKSTATHRAACPTGCLVRGNGRTPPQNAPRRKASGTG
jgi:hypothetical protein